MFKKCHKIEETNSISADFPWVESASKVSPCYTARFVQCQVTKHDCYGMYMYWCKVRNISAPRLRLYFQY